MALGRHVLAELSDCVPERLSDLEAVREAMVRAAVEAGAEVLETAFHRFRPHGVSGVVVIAESHLSIHTWPELGYAAIDVYTCGDQADPLRACQYLVDFFGSRTVVTTVVSRGEPKASGGYGHSVTTRELVQPGWGAKPV